MRYYLSDNLFRAVIALLLEPTRQYIFNGPAAGAAGLVKGRATELQGK